MYQIAIQMLLGDRVKYLILICALSFSTLLMTQQTAVFWGVMRWTTTMLRNTNVPIWIVDPKVEQITDIKPMRDIDLYLVKSVPGIEWAAPFYYYLIEGKVYDGNFTTVQLMGVDSSSLLGVPPRIIKGELEDLRKTNAIIVDKAGLAKLSRSLDRPLDIGDVIDINDHELNIVGIVEAEQSFFGYPFIYTTYDRAKEIAPPIRRSLGFILVQPKKGVDPEALIQEIKQQTGLSGYTQDSFFWSTLWWFFVNTGIPISFGATIALGFLIGIAVAGQTFYSFVYENLGNLGALKAMGASETLLKKMLFIQAFIAGCIGYGIGLCVSVIIGLLILLTEKLPFYLSWQIPVIVFLLIMVICFFSVYLGLRKLRKLKASEVFRG